MLRFTCFSIIAPTILYDDHIAHLKLAKQKTIPAEHKFFSSPSRVQTMTFIELWDKFDLKFLRFQSYRWILMIIHIKNQQNCLC